MAKIKWEADCGHEECTQWLIDTERTHGAEYALREALCVVAERAEDEAYHEAGFQADLRREGKVW